MGVAYFGISGMLCVGNKTRHWMEQRCVDASLAQHDHVLEGNSGMHMPSLTVPEGDGGRDIF